MPPRTPLPFTFNLRVSSFRIFASGKSTEFVAVEDALDTYVRNSTRENLLSLTVKLGAWKVTKKHGTDNWTDSTRADTIRKLDRWLIAESTAIGIFPKSRPIWSGNHNCYAYAMRCVNPENVGSSSRPGRYWNAHVPPDRKWEGDAGAESLRFVEGVRLDGQAQGREIGVLRSGLRCDPAPVPAPSGGDQYLVAMVAHPMGYHFMRRNDSTGLWSHKNGATSAVETYFYDWGSEQPLALTDRVVADLLANPERMSCSGMVFTAYFRVPAAGITVRGDPAGTRL